MIRGLTQGGCKLLACLLALVCTLVTCALVPGAAFAQKTGDPFAASMALDVADGTYLVDVRLEGGTGRAHIASPTTMVVEDGRAALTVVWSSPNYDYMVVAGTRFLATVEGDTSRFEIPLLALDEPFDVVADTCAMSVPHEISYTITAASESIVEKGSGSAADIAPRALVFACLGGAGLAFLVRRRAS